MIQLQQQIQQHLRLLADGPCKKALSLDRDLFHILIERLRDHVLRSCHLAAHAGNGKASLPAGLFSVFFNDPGIDQDDRLILLLADIDDDKPLEHSHLGGRKADAVRVVHSFFHIFDQLSDLGRHFPDLFGFFAENRIALLPDRSK